MRIRRITSIKTFKSFRDFSWARFCKNGSGQEEVLQKFTLIFGENGSGKSSICDVLKSFSQTQDFVSGEPDSAELEINNGSNNDIYKFENGGWSNQVNRNSFLFFDVDFVNANVHTHGAIARNLQQGGHTQKAGKLIIDLDEKANDLKKAAGTKKDELENFEKSHSVVLEEQFTERDLVLFKTFEDKDDLKKKELLNKTQEELKEAEANLVTLEKLIKKYSEISRLGSVGEISFSPALSTEKTYSDLFATEIKEKAQAETDGNIKAHFEKHRRFIESAKDQISENYRSENCPLCMQPLVNASRVIEYYRAVFDRSYENAKRAFLSDIQSLKNELHQLRSSLILIPTEVTKVFDKLEKIKTDFEIEGIYKLEEKTEHTKKFSEISVAEIDELLAVLESLRNIDKAKIDVTEKYGKAFTLIKEIHASFESLNELIAIKNKSITEFKSKYSEQEKITREIEEKTQKQRELKQISDFLKSEKLKLIKNWNEAVAKQKALSEELKRAQEELKNYLANTIPASVITQMVSILGKFNLSFTLEHIKPDPKTKDYSFSFRIKDEKGNEREFKDGLSEGERQLISLSFFFAINENLPDKEKTVLIFDDPITSLDSPNLKILAELIHRQTERFAQVLVFTHHPLFFKYMSKCENPSPYKFGVLKNTERFGGSFMFFDPGFDLTDEIKKCSEEIDLNAQNGNLKPEEIALKYGQLLRLAIEKFIKNDLLMWDKEKRFEELTENLKQGKSKMFKLTDDDLEVITNMYKYCNYSNLLHADKEAPSALSELIAHINKFSSILDKIRASI